MYLHVFVLLVAKLTSFKMMVVEGVFQTTVALMECGAGLRFLPR